jgi:hypothetical protein
VTPQDATGWAICLLLAGLISTFAATPSRRVRRLLFFVISGIGVGVGSYGFAFTYYAGQRQTIRILEWWGRGEARGAPPAIHGYFGLLGLPLSLAIAASLAFGILALDVAFTRQHLKRYVYRVLALLIVIWIAGTITHEAALALRSYTAQTAQYKVVQSGQFHLPSLLGHRGAHLLLFVAFLIGAWCSFPKKVFLILFPLGAVLTCVSLLLTRRTFPSMKLEELFAVSVWLFFWLLAYFYLNVHHHGDQTKSEKVKQIPKVALFLVGAGVLHDFPEYDVIRRLLPTVSLVAERVIIVLDVLLIVVLVGLTLSGQIFARGSVPSHRNPE